MQVLAVFLVAVAMALSLAHALELPGKMRLTKEMYLAVQSIYYPGFTIGGGVGEVLGMAATLALLFMTPAGSTAFWWTLGGLIALVAMQGVYWIVTHPVNSFWLKDRDLTGVSAGFFSFDPMKRTASAKGSADDNWNSFRNRWEYSHVLRAVFAAMSLIALVVAVATR